MSKRAKSEKPDKPQYGFVAFRPTPILDRRLRALAEHSGQSISAIVKECVAAHLATLEVATKEDAR